MKLIDLHKSEKKLIASCIKNNQKAQFELYKRFSPTMLSVCRMYIKDVQFAEDTMSKGFVKVFQQLHTFSFQGSFEGWIKRIMIRESIDFLRKKQPLQFTDEAYVFEGISDETEVYFERAAEAQAILDQLPAGYRSVFLLYEIENYSHKEIASFLGSTESTSKSQLFKCRKMINELVNQKKIRHEKRN